MDNDQDQMTLHKPLSEYKNIYKDLHAKNVDDFFNDLVLKSNVDIELNKSTVKEIRTNEKTRDHLAKTINSQKLLRTFLVILILGFITVLIYSVYQLTIKLDQVLAWVLIPFSIGLPIWFFILIKNTINPKIKLLKTDKDKVIEKIKELYSLAWAQMKSLNESFYDGMSQIIFQKTIPLIKMDQMFDAKRLDYLVSNFGLGDLEDLNRSTLYVQSGDLKGNPFYIAHDLVHKLGTKTYTGSITIHWTTTSRVNGRTVTNHRSQVLTASVTKPYPLYTEQSYLVYGNQAAPDLEFSRLDSDAEHMSEKQIDKHVDKSIKKLEKKSRKSLSKGSNYTVFGNPEFEVLFGATNRNHEVQFRLLFTPLAQIELLALMKEKTIGFGDDFDFIKHKMINIIVPEHLRQIKLDITPSYFESYDFEDIKYKFMTYQNAYFKHIYFAFAPILAIPLYQQTVTKEYIYKDLYPSHVSFFEHEHVVNSMDSQLFKHEESVTRNILKTRILNKSKDEDIIKVTAYGYKVIPRVHYETRMGGDGRLHTIPVHWDEYIEVNKNSEVEVKVQPEETPLTHEQRFRKMFTDLKDNKLEPKDIFLLKNFAARVLKVEKNDKIKQTKGNK